MHELLIDLLQCPHCQGNLRWEIREKEGEKCELGEARCAQCGGQYPIREGIGLFLTPDIDRDDLWEQIGSGIRRYLDDHPDIERRLMDLPVEELGPADLFYRAILLEEQGNFHGARYLEEATKRRLYTPEYLDCWQKQVDFLLGELVGVADPVIDLASGRGYLVERLCQRVDTPVVCSDFSPRVLRRNRRWFESSGLSDQVSLLAFDARRSPFKDGAIVSMTTNLGLPNITQASRLFAELRRSIGGRFLAITHFYPPNDANAQAIQEAGLDNQLYRQRTVAELEAAGFQVQVTNICRGRAEPTPRGELLAGASVDAFPIAATELEWCLVVAS